MHTFLWVIFILLIVIGLIYIGALISISLLIWVYAEDPEFWNSNIQPTLTDLRDWVDSGHKIKDYPKQKWKKQ